MVFAGRAHVVSERLPVSLCVNTRNASSLLPGCVASCSAWVAEVLVVDMDSEDDTAEVARELGARVVSIPNAGFVEAGRQQAIEACAQPWVLVLDADERAPSGLAEQARDWVARDDIAGVWLPMRNILFGRWLRHSGYWPAYQLRFLRRGAARWPAVVHTRPVVDGPTLTAPADPNTAIVHQNYATIRQWIERNDRYTDVQARALHEAGRAPSFLRLLLAPVREFVSRYVGHRGFRDGRQGLAVALLLALNHVALELKLWRLARSPAADREG
jgi:glycosyltransferase involved in cell wall biosynthesis